MSRRSNFEQTLYAAAQIFAIRAGRGLALRFNLKLVQVAQISGEQSDGKH